MEILCVLCAFQGFTQRALRISVNSVFSLRLTTEDAEALLMMGSRTGGMYSVF